MTDNFDFNENVTDERPVTEMNVDVPAYVLAVDEDFKVNVATNTWTWLTETGLEVYQSSGGNGIVYVKSDNSIQFGSTNVAYNWQIRMHK